MRLLRSPQCNCIQWFNPNERKNANWNWIEENLHDCRFVLHPRRSLSPCSFYAFIAFWLLSLLLRKYHWSGFQWCFCCCHYCCLTVSFGTKRKKKTNYKRKPKYSQFGAYIWWFWILSGWADINRNQWHSNIRFSSFLNGVLDIYHLKWSRAWHCKFLKGKRKNMVTFRSFLTVVSSMTG